MTGTALIDLLLDDDQGLAAAGPSIDRGTLRSQALSLAGGLRKRGISRLAVHLDDAAELAATLLGAWRAGVQVFLPADLQPASRQRLDTQVDAWLTEQPEDLAFAALLDAPLPPARLDPTFAGLVLCTSGSSGAPKLIDKALFQLGDEVAALEALWGNSLGTACVIGSVSTQHIYGLLFRVLWPLCAGRPFQRRTCPFPEDLQQASLAQSAFCWVASPALLKRMGENLDWPALAAVRQVFSSGGALPAAVSDSLAERLGQPPVQVYGSSETGGVAWCQGDDSWQPLPGVELAANDEGALRVASPWLPRGHVEQTADAAALDADGRFRLLGRLDRIVKLEEKRISLPMLEQALAAHPAVVDARLGVVQDNRAYLGALVALSPLGLHKLRNGGRRTLIETLRTHLAAHCEALALPRRWRLLLELPGNAQGKLPQAEVEALLQSPRTTRPDCLAQTRSDSDDWQLTLRVPADLAHFAGHFPTTPVLPGVVQIDWALSLARELIALPPRFKGMEVLKFQQLARPGDRLALSLRFDSTRSKLYFAYRNGELPCSSGRILLGE